jgi:hypothetical protein
MNKAHPVSQFLTAFFGLSLFAAIYVCTPNRSVSSSRTPTQAVASQLGPLNLP